MENPQQGKKREIKLHFPQDVKVTYSNLAVMTITRQEFIIDFAQLLPPDPRANVQSRVVITPQHAKVLLTLLQRNIEKYEAQYGEIPLNLPPTLAEQLFNSVQSSDDDDKE